MIRIWGRKAAFNVQKVLWCADELALAYERVDAGQHYGVVNTPAYRAKNPNGRIPTLEDGDLVLWESNVIVRYLSAQYGIGKLWPEDARKRADADRWMDWQVAALFYPTFRTFYLSTTRDPPEKQDKAALESLRQSIVHIFGILERHLETRSYVSGETLTMGDIPIGTTVDKWLRMPIERPAMPALDAYYERLNKSDAYRACVVNVPLSAI